MDDAIDKAGYFVAQAKGQGKAARTRARLLDAAVALFARHGFGRATAFDIAAEAQVANGTFYTYFSDRDDITQAVAIGMAEITAARLAVALPSDEDARARVAYTTICFAAQAAADAAWGKLLLQAIAADASTRLRTTAFIRADLELGLAQGHFAPPIDQALLDAIGALTLAALAASLDGAGHGMAQRMAALQLAMLGVPQRDANDIAAQAARRVPVAGRNASASESDEL